MSSRYFKSRVEAGEKLAAILVPKYRHKDCAIIALSDGGVMVGAQIAMKLHCVLTMLLTAPITLPREPEAVAVIDQSGNFTFNSAYSDGEIDELQGEFRNYIDQQRLQKLHDINSLIGHGGVIRRDLVNRRIVIIVNDGLTGGFALDAVAQFLKPIQINKLVVATPLANVPAVDKMHVIADEIVCLNVVYDYMNTEHYYEANDVPDHKATLKIIQDIVLHWQ